MKVDKITAYAYPLPMQLKWLTIDLNNPIPDKVTKLYQFVANDLSEDDLILLPRVLLKDKNNDKTYITIDQYLESNDSFNFELTKWMPIFKAHKDIILEMSHATDLTSEALEANPKRVYEMTMVVLGLVATDILNARAGDVPHTTRVRVIVEEIPINGDPITRTSELAGTIKNGKNLIISEGNNRVTDRFDENAKTLFFQTDIKINEQ